MSPILRGGPLDGRPILVRHGKDWYVVHTRDGNEVYRWCPLRSEYRYEGHFEGSAEEAYELHARLNARD